MGDSSRAESSQKEYSAPPLSSGYASSQFTAKGSGRTTSSRVCASHGMLCRILGRACGDAEAGAFGVEKIRSAEVSVTDSIVWRADEPAV